MSDCPRCQQDENYGCGCSTLELLDYEQDRDGWSTWGDQVDKFKEPMNDAAS